MGHQAICEVLGGKIVYAPELMHGRQSIITVDNTSTIFQGLPQTVEAARYHSLAADKKQSARFAKSNSKGRTRRDNGSTAQNGKTLWAAISSGIDFNAERKGNAAKFSGSLRNLASLEIIWLQQKSKRKSKIGKIVIFITIRVKERQERL